MRFVRKVAHGRNGAPVDPQRLLGLTFGPLAALGEYLTLEVWEDGTARRTSTLLMFIEDGVWKVCLRDRANSRTLWRAGESPEEALAALEAALEGDATDWRRDHWEGDKGKPRRRP
jgi:predicted RNase H-like HicB family nuclease